MWEEDVYFYFQQESNVGHKADFELHGGVVIQSHDLITAGGVEEIGATAGFEPAKEGVCDTSPIIDDILREGGDALD